MNRANAWTTYEEADIKALEGLCKEYKDFLSNGKTERECVAQSIELAKKAGYQDLEELIKNQTPLKAGDKVYRTWMEKTIVLFQIGEDAIEDGLNILGAHIDSPRLDLKQNPLYEDTEMALLDTHYYGGVKKYQWVTLPMALHGVVVKKDGTRVNICIGEKDEDPVVGITDLLIHLSGKQMQKKGNVIVEGEDLNVLIGSKPLKDEEKEAHLLTEWLAKFPSPFREEMQALYSEMEERQTLEARIYKALDNLEALIQHNESDIDTWIPLEYVLRTR